mmetsp:Transcript_47173/g.145230  ORF Transcript_47173/g.145230 Transcript_47173/m.145230 type:complete len:334 (-) Transcript_47173:91-1092(-)
MTRRLLRVLLALPLVANRAAAARVKRSALQKDSECSDLPSVTREACLSKTSLCMWIELDSKNLCLPCEWNGTDIPCAASGSVYPQGKVRRCDMACGHRKVITKVSPCTDVSGQITQEACMARGATSRIKCAWTSYTTNAGVPRKICGPCLVPGIGVVPAYAPGNSGPEPGSRVVESSSQCAPSPPELGGGGNGTNATDATNATDLQPASLGSLGLRAVKGSPHYVAVRVPRPYGPEEYREASKVAAAAAGWPAGEAVPTDAAFAILGPDPKDDRLPVIRTVASRDTTNYSRRYVLPPPGILGLPPVVPIGMDTPAAGGMNATAGGMSTGQSGC